MLPRRPAPGGFQEPWYRTGDQVRSLDDGNLVFAGRADRQVKVRGFRVELEEVERALLDLEAVFEAAVWVVPDGEGSSALRAAVVADPAAKASPRRLAGALKQALPAYAVPGRIDLVDAMPRTPTGKVDRRALAALVAADDTATAGAD